MTDTKSSSLAVANNQLPNQATSSTTTTLLNLDDTIDTLGQKSQSLLRTMRLDTVLLSAQHEESRSILHKLEKDWIMLQGLLDEQRRRAVENNSNETAAAADDDPNNEQQQKTNNTQFRRNSSIEWSEGGLESSEQQQQTTLHSLNLSDSNPNNSSRSNNNNNNNNSNKKSLDDSNFDWGQEDDADNNELQRVDRMADQSEPLTLDTTLNSGQGGDQNTNGKEEDIDDLPPVRRMFGFGRRGDDENGNNNNNRRREKSKNNNNNKVINKEPDTPSSLSSSLFGSGRPPFLGGSGRRQQLDKDDDASSVTMGSRNNFSWQGLFRRDNGSSGKKTEEEMKKNAATEVDLSNSIATMQVKLRGCDAAASSLQQLVSYQKRQIVDLKCERDRLKLTSEFENLRDQSELDLLRNQVEQAQMEKKGKIRLLKEAENDNMNAIDREERLKEELECVRMELFMLSNNSE